MERRRAIILEATERLLQRYGPGKTTMADIAREASISVGALYLEFESKEAIVEELSSRRHAAIFEQMRAAASTERPWAERLRAVFDARVDAFLEAADGGAHAADLVHCNAVAAVKAVHDRFRDEELRLVTDLLRAGAKAGELDVARPEATARALLAAYARFSPPWLWHTPRDETRALLRAVHDLVLYGLVRRRKR